MVTYFTVALEETFYCCNEADSCFFPALLGKV